MLSIWKINGNPTRLTRLHGASEKCSRWGESVKHCSRSGDSREDDVDVMSGFTRQVGLQTVMTENMNSKIRTLVVIDLFSVGNTSFLSLPPSPAHHAPASFSLVVISCSAAQCMSHFSSASGLFHKVSCSPLF